MGKKWINPVGAFRLAVGMVFPIDTAPENPAGVISYLAPQGAQWQKFYLSMSDVEDSYNIELVAPESILDASWAELLFNKRPGYRVIFGRHGETRPFDFSRGYYMPLRLYQIERAPAPDWEFNPLYIRVDYKDDTQFYVLSAGWREDKVFVRIEELENIDVCPSFLLFPEDEYLPD